MSKRRLLFLKAGPYFLPDDIQTSGKYRLFSRLFSGEIVAVIKQKKHARGRIGRFLLRGLWLPPKVRHSSLKNLPFLVFAVVSSVYRHWVRKKYDAVIAYDPLLTGLTALIISRLTGARLIVEVNGNYSHALNLTPKGNRIASWIRSQLILWMIPFVLNRAHGIKVLYDGQLAPLDRVHNQKSIHRFHEYVPIKQFRADQPRGNYVLFMGFPWYLKGVDILIKAFNQVADKHPEYRLMVVGYCQDKSQFQSLAGDNERITLHDPVFYEEAISLMEMCSLFVLPSRSEAMGRVLFEAMASQKAIIASKVDGIPTYIIDGYNGLLFSPEDHKDLAAKLDLLMNNSDLTETLASNGKTFVHSYLSEEIYLKKYCEFIECTLKGHCDCCC